MAASYPFRYLYAFIEMMLLALHIVAIGSVVGVTTYIAYYIGRKNGLNSTEKEN